MTNFLISAAVFFGFTVGLMGGVFLLWTSQGILQTAVSVLLFSAVAAGLVASEKAREGRE